MATGIKSWSTTAASNDSADSSINWLENQAPSTVNNSARAMMAAIRTQYNQTEWRDWGHTVAYASATTFTIAGTDVTSIYTEGRAIKCVDSSTLYGFVVSSSFSTDTTVTVVLDSGSLSASLASVELGPETTNPSIGPFAIKWGEAANVASVSDCDIWTGDGHAVHVTGTTTITDWGTAPAAGSYMWVIFDGALQLTYNATTNDINANGANYTTTAGDMALVYARSTSSYKVIIFPYSGGSASQGSSLVLLQSQTASSSATIDFTSTYVNSTYDQYFVTLTNVDAATTATDLLVRLSQSGTFIAGSNYYWGCNDITQAGTSTGSGGSAQGEIRLCNSIDNSNTRSSLSGIIYFAGPSDTTYEKHFWGQTSFESSAGNFVTRNFAGTHIDATAMDGIRFLMSSGNINSGTFRLYGIKNS